MLSRLRGGRPRASTSRPLGSGSVADEELVARLAAQDPRAIEYVYDHWGMDTYAVAMSILGDQALAEDVVLDAHLELWRKPAIALTRHHSVQSYLHDVVFRDAWRRRTASHVQTDCVSDVARGAMQWAAQVSTEIHAAVQPRQRQSAAATHAQRPSA